MNLKKSKQRAITLINVIVIIGVIGVIGAIITSFTPKIKKSLEESRRAEQEKKDNEAAAVAAWHRACRIIVEQGLHSQTVLNLKNGLLYISETNGNKAVTHLAGYLKENMKPSMLIEANALVFFTTNSYWNMANDLKKKFEIDHGYFVILQNAGER